MFYDFSLQFTFWNSIFMVVFYGNFCSANYLFIYISWILRNNFFNFYRFLLLFYFKRKKFTSFLFSLTPSDEISLISGFFSGLMSLSTLLVTAESGVLSAKFPSLFESIGMLSSFFSSWLSSFFSSWLSSFLFLSLDDFVSAVLGLTAVFEY